MVPKPASGKQQFLEYELNNNEKVRRTIIFVALNFVGKMKVQRTEI